MARTVLLLHGSADRYGADRQLALLAAGLDRSRYRPLVVLPRPGTLASLLEEGGVETAFAPFAVLQRRFLAGRGLARTLRRLARSRAAVTELGRRHRADLVHTNSSILLGGQRVAGRLGVPHVLHVREIYTGGGGPGWDALWPLLRGRLLRADALACVSGAAAEQFGDVPGVHLVPDCVGRPTSPVPRAQARATLGLAPDSFVVAVVGRLSDWKGQRVLVRAMAEPALADRGAVVLVAGAAAPGQERFERELTDLGRRLGLGDRLRLLGFRDDVETVLGAADVAAVPCTRPAAAAMPGTALEALVAGVPLVASDVGGLPEVVHDGANGRLVPPADPLALAAALAELAADPARADTLSRTAAQARERFTVGRTVEAMQACYDATLA